MAIIVVGKRKDAEGRVCKPLAIQELDAEPQ